MVEKLSHVTADVTAENIEKIAQLFPQVVKEGVDASGKVTRGIDFEALKLELSNVLLEPERERYELGWPGKAQAKFTANQPIAKTLRPDRAESVDFETTQNIFIEGDNLDALKILQNSYQGQVKLIYIDPPYNTGNDFVYRDDFAEDRDSYLERSGQLDEDGNRLESNSSASGRFHSDWLSMMFSRFQLAKRLLREDGVIAVSIDDDELPRLRQMMDEVFGERNFYACVTWQKKYSPANDAKRFSDVHDYVVFYAKSGSFKRNLFPRTEENNKPYKYDDNDGRGKYASDNLSVRTLNANNVYEVTNPVTGKKHLPAVGRCWAYNKERMQQLINENRIFWGQDGDSYPRLKRYLSDVQQGTVPITLWDYDFAGHTDQARKEIRALFGTTAVFDTPKPTKLLQRILQVATDKDTSDIVLDFFAGSSTTAHAVMKQNAEDEGNRRFIMVQLDEEHRREEYGTVSAVSRERIRRAATAVREEAVLQAENLDLGFRAFTVGTSNFADNLSTAGELTQADLTDQLSSVKLDRTNEDVLFQTLLSLGMSLDLPLEKLNLPGVNDVYSVDDGAVLACFDVAITDDKVTALAEHARDILATGVPVDVAVFLDSSFKADSTRVNLNQVFSQYSPDTQLKVI